MIHVPQSTYWSRCSSRRNGLSWPSPHLCENVSNSFLTENKLRPKNELLCGLGHSHAFKCSCKHTAPLRTKTKVFILMVRYHWRNMWTVKLLLWPLGVSRILLLLLCFHGESERSCSYGDRRSCCGIPTCPTASEEKTTLPLQRPLHPHAAWATASVKCSTRNTDWSYMMWMSIVMATITVSKYSGRSAFWFFHSLKLHRWFDFN